MIRSEDVAVVLLAAGSSSRFGSQDKLAVPIDGLALGMHIARTLNKLPFRAKIAVVRPGAQDFRRHDFDPVVNDTPDVGLSSSIRAGVLRARTTDPRAILITLADMPFVTSRHIHAMLAQFSSDHSVIGSTSGGQNSPPALLGGRWYTELEGLSGDYGARSILSVAEAIYAPPDELRDFDTLEELRAYLASRSDKEAPFHDKRSSTAAKNSAFRQ